MNTKKSKSRSENIPLVIENLDVKKYQKNKNISQDLYEAEFGENKVDLPNYSFSE